MNRQLAIVAVAALVAACGGKKEKALPIQTAAVTRQTIVVDAEANGTVEPINIVEVKSKASGLITKMPVETGDLKKPGDLLVQIDTRDVQNQFNQADAALKAAQVKLQVSTSAKNRSDEMFKARVITQDEHEQAALDYENAKSGVVSAAANLDLARQRLEDATVAAPVAGTVIEKDVSQGVVITSATGAFGGGTTLLKMADLTTVRVRAFFNETDIGQVRPAQQATVIVDAYPDRRFQGLVEKIEPQAVVQQGVTMFPVLVTLDNREGYLKPGMNGEVSVLVDQLNDVLAVPIDAVKTVREAVTTAPMLGLNPDSVQAEIRAQFAANSGGSFGGGAGGAGAANGQRRGGNGQGSGRTTGTARGEVALDPQQGGGFQMPDVSDKDCAAVKTAMAKKPDSQKKLDDLRDQMRNGSIDRQAAFQQMQQIYASVGVDARIAGACRMKERMAQGGAAPNGAPTNVAQSGRARNGRGGSTQVGGPLRPATGEAPPVTRRARPGLVFVAEGEKEKRTYHPRVIMLGQSNFDYSEVVSGLKEGEQVVLLSALTMQAQRQQNNDRFRGMTGIPGMQNQGGGARPGGAAGGAAPRGGGR